MAEIEAEADTEAEDATAPETEEGSRRTGTVTAPRAGERSIVDVVIVVVEDDLLGAPPSCPRIRSRTLGRHQILSPDCHRSLPSTCPSGTFPCPGACPPKSEGDEPRIILQGRNVTPTVIPGERLSIEKSSLLISWLELFV